MDLPLILDILLLRFANNRITPKRSLSVTAARAGFQRLTVVTIRSRVAMLIFNFLFQHCAAESVLGRILKYLILRINTLRQILQSLHLTAFGNMIMIPQKKYFTPNSALLFTSVYVYVTKYKYKSVNQIPDHFRT